MLISNFGSITGMQDQQTPLAVSASKLSFSFLTLNVSRQGILRQDLRTQILSTETQHDGWWRCGVTEVLISDFGEFLWLSES